MTIADELVELNSFAEMWLSPEVAAAARKIIIEDLKPPILSPADKLNIAKETFFGTWLVIPVSRGTGSEVMYINFDKEGHSSSNHKAGKRQSIFGWAMSKINTQRFGHWWLRNECLEVSFRPFADGPLEVYKFHIGSAWHNQILCRDNLGIPLCFYRIGEMC